MSIFVLRKNIYVWIDKNIWIIYLNGLSLYYQTGQTKTCFFFTMYINPAVAEAITEAFIKGLQAGRIPWKRGWKNGKRSNEKWNGFESDSINVASGKHYNGINALLLDSLGLSLPVWGTYNQWKDLTVHVKSGEKGLPVVYSDMIITDKNKKRITRAQYNELSPAEQKQCTQFFTKKYSVVFHIGQIDGDKKAKLVEKWTAKFAATKTKTDDTPTPAPVEPEPFFNDMAEQIVANWDVTVKHEDQNRAYYSPGLDYIMMPTKNQFEGEAMYYETLFHEGIHASGHSKRLDRKSLTEAGRFGDANYSFEELVAEIGSAYVCAHLNIEQNLENKVAYVNGWISKLGENPTWIIQASGMANKAAGWVLGWLDGETSPTTVETPELEMA
jgi:antirestriction protein ArdC